jgi:hypothetical protein
VKTWKYPCVKVSGAREPALGSLQTANKQSTNPTCLTSSTKMVQSVVPFSKHNLFFSRHLANYDNEVRNITKTSQKEERSI